MTFGLPEKEACISFEMSSGTQLAEYREVAQHLGLNLLVDDVLVLDRRRLPTSRDRSISPIVDESDWRAIEDHAIAQDGFLEGGLRSWLLRQRKALCDAGEGSYYGAWDDGDLIASCGLFGTGNICRLDQLLVRPQARGQGVGSDLISSISRMVSATWIAMEPAHGNWRSSMYRKIGYVDAGLTISLIGPC
jgi:GNAT superfamily N-acetyltransferase